MEKLASIVQNQHIRISTPMAHLCFYDENGFGDIFTIILTVC